MSINGRVNFSGSTQYTDPTAGLRKAGDVFAKIFAGKDAKKAKDEETARIQGNADRSFALQKQGADRAEEQFQQTKIDDRLASLLVQADQNASRNIENINNTYANAESMTPQQLMQANADAVASAEAGAFQGSADIIANPELTQGASGRMLLNERTRVDKLNQQDESRRTTQLRDINNQSNANRTFDQREQKMENDLSIANQKISIAQNAVKATKENTQAIKAQELKGWQQVAISQGVEVTGTDTVDTIKSKMKTNATGQKVVEAKEKEDRKIVRDKKKELKIIGDNPGKYLGDTSGIDMDTEAYSKLNKFLKVNGAKTNEQKKAMVDLIKSSHETSILPDIWDSDFEDTLDRIVKQSGLNQNW